MTKLGHRSGGVSSFVVRLGMLCAALMFAFSVHAQIGATSSVSGQILDASHAAVVGATVTLTDLSLKSSKTATSNDVGRYTFNDVQPGNYEISVTKDGFQTSRIAKQEVVVGVPVTLDFALQVGATSLTVEVVSTAGAQLQTTNATTGDSLGGETLLNLPAVARDASALVVFQPGVTMGGNVAGQEADQNTFMVDGANNSQDMDGGNNTYLTGFGGASNGTVPTPAESVEEFKVNTSGQTADFYSSGGAQVQLVTKKGTNNWHGSAYDFFQADFLNANDFTDNQEGNAKIKQHQNRFGASLGGPLTPKFWGGKTYFYANYEGRRFPQAQFLTRTTPTALMRAGVLQFNDLNGNPVFYNFNPTATTVGGTTYPGGAWDPRGIGVNTLLQTMWNTYMPLPNLQSFGDRVNTQGFNGAVSLPTTDDTGVVRIDHDFGSKWHVFSSYRMYKLESPSTVQTDIGGFSPGSTFGTYSATANRPSEPSLLVAGITGQLTPNLTNDFHVNYTRNDWQWGDISGNANLNQIPGVPAAVEPGGESANALIPMNVNTQSTRQRIWDGHDYYYRDDMSLLHGNHFLSFGGQVNRNWLYHTRNDNGSATDVNTTYLINSASIDYVSGHNLPTTCVAAPGPGQILANCLPAGQIGNYEQESAELLGIVDLPQVLLTRAGPNLAIQPAGTSAFDQSTILTYDVYFSDSWHIKPSLTLTYGLNYGIQMPPHEAQGKQVLLVDANGNAISASDYLSNRYNAAINGNFSSPTYTPELGFELVNNVGSGKKYPYDPYYGGFGPRVALAWSPSFSGGWKEKMFGHNSTVLRGGYSRVFTRENGVDLVLVPLLGVGLFQGSSCQDPLRDGVTCAGPNGATPATAFRLGTDGLVAPLPTPAATLPQPVYPGVGGQAKATATLMLDSKLRPGATDQFNLSLQRSFAKGFIMEVGYIGIKANHLYMGVDLDQVPFMSTLGGQSFAQAYANIEQATLAGNAIQPQPFIEAAMAGSSVCTGFTSCTAAVMSGTGLNQGTNFSQQNVYNIWQAISAHFNPTIFPPFNPATGFGGTDTSLNGQAQAEYMASSLGISNYNAGYVSLRKQTSFGLTFNANLTYSHEMGSVNGGQAFNGESPTNSWDPAHSDYTTGGFDQRFVFNMLGSYALPFGKGQHGFVGHVIGGWTVAPILTWSTGNPILVEDGSCQEAGQAPAESNCSQAVQINGAGTLNNIPHGNFAGIVSGSDGVGSDGDQAPAGQPPAGFGHNYFQNPSQGLAAFRPFILGVDQNGNGNGGPITNPNNWNLSFTVAKDVNIRESMGLTFTAAFFNALNHTNWAAGGGGVNGPAQFSGWSLQTTEGFGVMNPYNNPRTIELGLRFHF